MSKEETVTYTPYMSFYSCMGCGDITDCGRHGDILPPKVCGKCGSESFEYLVGRWKMIRRVPSFWEDVLISLAFMRIPETKFEFVRRKKDESTK